MDAIPFVDLKAQYASLKDEADAAILRVIADCAFVQGPAVQAFEQAFARRLQVAHCVACSNGTSALELALRAVGVQPGDQVITVAHTFFATVEAIYNVGATPVFVDIDPLTHTLDPALLEAAITPQCRAVLPVHLYGGPCAMGPILEIARRHGLKVVEDAAQAHLASWQGQMVGGMGDAACFSFYPGKNLGAWGDAGAVTTNDPEVAQRMRMQRDHGRLGKYEHQEVGSNHRMDGIQGAVLGVKLPHLDSWTAARRQAAALYDSLVQPLGLKTVQPAKGAAPVYHLYVVELPAGLDRTALQARLQADGIATGVHYPIPCHRQPALRDRPEAACSLPHSERLADRVLSLPLFPEITEQQIRRVVASLAAAMS